MKEPQIARAKGLLAAGLALCSMVAAAGVAATPMGASAQSSRGLPEAEPWETTGITVRDELRHWGLAFTYNSQDGWVSVGTSRVAIGEPAEGPARVEIRLPPVGSEEFQQSTTAIMVAGETIQIAPDVMREVIGLLTESTEQPGCIQSQVLVPGGRVRVDRRSPEDVTWVWFRPDDEDIGTGTRLVCDPQLAQLRYALPKVIGTDVTTDPIGFYFVDLIRRGPLHPPTPEETAAWWAFRDDIVTASVDPRRVVYSYVSVEGVPGRWVRAWVMPDLIETLSDEAIVRAVSTSLPSVDRSTPTTLGGVSVVELFGDGVSARMFGFVSGENIYVVAGMSEREAQEVLDALPLPGY